MYFSLLLVAMCLFSMFFLVLSSLSHFHFIISSRFFVCSFVCVCVFHTVTHLYHVCILISFSRSLSRFTIAVWRLTSKINHLLLVILCENEHSFSSRIKNKGDNRQMTHITRHSFSVLYVFFSTRWHVLRCETLKTANVYDAFCTRYLDISYLSLINTD